MLPRLLIADHPPTRAGVRLALADAAVVCAEADDADGAVRAAAEHRPQVALVGETIAGGGLEAVRRIHERVPDALIVLLAAGDDPDLLVAAVEAGAVGLVPPGFAAAQLRRAVEVVLAGEAAVPRAMVLSLVRAVREAQRAVDARLSVREVEVLALLRRGESTATIASQLSISPVTVRRHISSLVSKTGVRRRSDLR